VPENYIFKDIVDIFDKDTGDHTVLIIFMVVFLTYQEPCNLDKR